jgi:hypothetical protein
MKSKRPTERKVPPPHIQVNEKQCFTIQTEIKMINKQRNGNSKRYQKLLKFFPTNRNGRFMISMVKRDWKAGDHLLLARVVSAGLVEEVDFLVVVVDVEELHSGFHQVIQMISLSISFRGWEEVVVGLVGWRGWMIIRFLDLVEVDVHDREGVVEGWEGVCLGCLRVLLLNQKSLLDRYLCLLKSITPFVRANVVYTPAQQNVLKSRGNRMMDQVD